jgi:hypothetical protein
MSFWKRINTDLFWICLLALASMLIHFLAYKPLGFHRDEFLYLAIGRHLDTGYWSNPPLIGLISALSQLLPGDSLFVTRFFPALAGAFLVILTGLISAELGGKRFAQIFSCLGLISCILFLRGYSMLQPVPFDIFFWTLSLYFLLKYFNTKNWVLIILLGITFGLGILNKYNVVFLASGIIIAVLLTKHRDLFRKSYTWIALLIAFLLFIPNLLWQIQHHFPVVEHMNELTRNQLVHVNRLNIITDQFFMYFGSSILWFPGLLWLLFSVKAKEYRVFGYTYLVVLAIYILLHGKSYYTAGLYPFILAAGGVFWENLIKRNYSRIIIVTVVLLLNLPLIPNGIPIFKTEGLVEYYKTMSIKTGNTVATRWEEGRIHALPQDYADMLGWDELYKLVEKACDTVKNRSSIMIYAENYGEAGSIDHYLRPLGYEQAVSFNDNYLLWAPDSISEAKSIFIYVNDELGHDVSLLFAQIDSIGCIKNIYAREQGTTVYMCRNPRTSFPKFWSWRVKQVKAERLR